MLSIEPFILTMKCTTMRSLALPLLAFFSLTISARPHGHEEHPVCIIGAGPAGLSAASRLKSKGIKSMIFEKQEAVGGKCQSWYDEDGTFYPLGAAFLSNVSYPETIAILSQTDVSTQPFSLAGGREAFSYNYTDGRIQQVPALAPQFLAQVSAEIPRYVGLWNTRFRPVGVANFKNGVPDEFTVSGAEWFRINNFTALPILLVTPVALYGYGDINIVPALYILQYMTPDVLTAFVGLHGVYYMDFNKMWVEFAKNNLRETTIKTSADVRRVDRSGANPVLMYTEPAANATHHKRSKQTCSSVIFAFPPSIDNLKHVGLDLTPQETSTFSNVTTHQYYSSVSEFALPFGVSYAATSPAPSIPPPNDGQPVAILRFSPRSNISVAWSWGPYDYQPEQTARHLLVDSLRKINKDPRQIDASVAPFCDDDIKAFRKWDYFPHFEGPALRAGAYAAYHSLQGVKKTYFASGLAGMELVEFAIRGGYDVVDSYF
ncbi:hypothetical protein IAQ61_005795 [Plenodomus lingam]|uniref:uncharacterized protein n=1 Tax=Leptosphaeria maculans TaxID=5022 RepID=UPI00332C983E|nr:hypothetical protein IAQ61_005795 [Plenodomus lingam]